MIEEIKEILVNGAKVNIMFDIESALLLGLVIFVSLTLALLVYAKLSAR